MGRALSFNNARTYSGEALSGSEPTLTDSRIDWEKTYEYRAETVTLIAQENKPELQIEGDDTPEVKVFTHDIFPPAVPSGLQAAASGPGQKMFVDLIWAPVTDADLDEMIGRVMMRCRPRRNKLQIVDNVVRAAEVVDQGRRTIRDRDPPRHIVGDDGTE